MLLPSRRHGAVEDGGWCAAAESITIMRPVDVTEAQEVPEAAVQRPLLCVSTSPIFLDRAASERNAARENTEAAARRATSENRDLLTTVSSL